MRRRLPGNRAGNGSVERGARGRVRTPHPGASGLRPPALRPAAFNGWTRRRYEGRKPLRLGSPHGPVMSRFGGPGLRPRAPFGSTVPRLKDAARGAPQGDRAFLMRRAALLAERGHDIERQAALLPLAFARDLKTRASPGPTKEQGWRSVGLSRRSAREGGLFEI